MAENALPVLERLGFRATVFLPTGVIDGTASFPWYDRQPPMLGWDEVVELDRGGTLRFEPHTVTHPNLLLLDDAASRFEIAQSKLDLESRLGRPARVVLLPGRAVRRARAQVRRRVGLPRGRLLRAGSQPARRRPADAAPAPDRPGRPAAGLPREGRRRPRHAAAAARALPSPALRGRRAATPAGCGDLMEHSLALRPPPARAAGRLLGTAAALAAFAAALSLSPLPPSAQPADHRRLRRRDPGLALADDRRLRRRARSRRRAARGGSLPAGAGGRRLRRADHRSERSRAGSACVA